MEIDAGTLYTLADGLIKCMEELGRDVPDSLELVRNHAEVECHEARKREADERRKYREIRAGHVSALNGAGA